MTNALMTHDGRKISKTSYVDNVEGSTVDFHATIMEAIRGDGKLPYELSDLLTLTLIEVDDGIRGIVCWA